MKSTKEEFLEILSNYQGILYKVCLIYFKNRSDREDNFQEIVYQLWKSFPSLKNRNSIGSWIYAVAINTSISRIKRETKIEYSDSVPELPDRINIAQTMEVQESFQLLLDAIYQLDEINKSIMLLYLEEKSYAEIADIIGISTSNVGVRISRAKELLKRNIKE
ncbi:MAG: RNA polymerase sigma factor [Marinilabiliaceae bacterium]|nr:RNA polymerase sigma factor [Marinilabiliaceae bacterium]